MVGVFAYFYTAFHTVLFTFNHYRIERKKLKVENLEGFNFYKKQNLVSHNGLTLKIFTL